MTIERSRQADKTIESEELSDIRTRVSSLEESQREIVKEQAEIHASLRSIHKRTDSFESRLIDMGTRLDATLKELTTEVNGVVEQLTPFIQCVVSMKLIVKVACGIVGGCAGLLTVLTLYEKLSHFI